VSPGSCGQDSWDQQGVSEPLRAMNRVNLVYPVKMKQPAARQSATGFTGSTGFLEGRFRRAPSLDPVLIGSWAARQSWSGFTGSAKSLGASSSDESC